MIALAPWLMDLFRGGKFNRADAATTTRLFSILAITLAVWAVQGIYARAFYAAGDTKTPAITGTLITILSVPMYWALFRAHSLTGLAIASDIGIVIQTASLTFLLHRKRLVSLRPPRVPRTRPRPRRRTHRLHRHLRPRPRTARRHHPPRRLRHPRRRLHRMAALRPHHPHHHRQQTAETDPPAQLS